MKGGKEERRKGYKGEEWNERRKGYNVTGQKG